MKRILTVICLILLCALFIVSCDSAPSTSDDYQNNNNYYDNGSNNYYNGGTNNYYDNGNNQQSGISQIETTPNFNNNDSTDKPVSEAPSTEKSTGSTGCITHSWKSATCTEPKTCSKCGATDGEAKGHNFKSYNDYKCECGELDPKVAEALNKCSLELPSLPQEVKRYSYNGSLQSSVSVTKIVPTFEYYDNNKIILTVKFSGTKTYDYQGSNQSSPCYIGWKLYDPDGNVFRSGTFSSSNVATGESFANKEEDLIYNFEAAEPGAYKLVLLDVN